jgi:Ca-activated chloride channel family protein
MPVVTRRSAPLVAAAVTGAALIVPFRMFFPDCGPNRGFLDRDPVELRVLAPKQSGPLITELATEKFLSTRPEIGGRCIVVHVDKMSSGDAEGLLAGGWPTPHNRPDVWMPLTRTWVDLLRQDLLRKGAPPLVGDDVADINRTPEVIALPEPMAAALGWTREVGWSGTDIGWKTIYDLAQNPEGWKSKGEQFERWGRFWLARTNPNTSTSGLYSTIAAYYAGKRQAGLPNDLDLTTGDVLDGRIVEFVKGVESSVLLYGDTSLSMLPRLYDATARNEATEFISAITVAETSVVNYNLGYPAGEARGEKRGPPSVKLVALYPEEGTLFADQVYVTLNWVTGDKRKAAKKLLQFLLQSETAQGRFREHGFRKPESALGRDVLDGAPWIAPDAATVTALRPPAADVVMAVRDLWETLRKRARVLIVVDLSDAASGIGGIQSMVEKVVNERLHPEDEVGVWALSPGDPTYVELAPLGPLGTRPNRLEATGRWPLGAPGNRLYTALQAAMDRFVDANKINGIVLLTDGHHEEAGHNSFLGNLAGRRHLGVRVFPIGFGRSVDRGALGRIAQTSRTKASSAVTSEKFEEIFTEVVKSL